MTERPAGTVTFLYTNIEGSTAHWEQAPAAMRWAVDRHATLIRQAVAAYDGHVFRTVGDGTCAAFATAPAALAAQQTRVTKPWGKIGLLRVRLAAQPDSSPPAPAAAWLRNSVSV
jgi:class 3 adenylate cyclase